MRILTATTLLVFFAPVKADNALLECRQIDNANARLACYDALVDARHTDSPPVASRESERAEPPGREAPRSIPDPEALFGTNDAEAKHIIEESLEMEQIDRIEAVVAQVERSNTRKLTVALDNGQVWRQLDNQRLLVESGDSVVIREASFSSFLMQKSGGGRSIRVKRIE